MKFDRYGEYLGYGVLKSDTELSIQGKTVKIVGVPNPVPVCTSKVLFLCSKNEDKEVVVESLDDLPTMEAVELSEGSFISMVHSAKSGKCMVAVRREDIDTTEENGMLCISGTVGGVTLRASARVYNLDQVLDADVLVIFGEHPLIDKQAKTINMAEVDIYLVTD